MLSIALYICIAGLLVVAFTKKRILVLCAFYACYGFLTILNEDGTPLLEGFKVYRLIYPILLLSIVARAFQDQDFGARVRRWPLLAYFALLFTLAISSLYSPSNSVFSFENTAGLLDRAFIFSLFWMSASQVQEESDLSVFAAATGIVSLFLSGWVIWNAAALNFSAYRGGTSVNENYLSMVVLLGAMALVRQLFATSRRLLKVAVILALLCIAVASVILASRGIFIAAVVASLFVVTGEGLRSDAARRKLFIFGGLTLAVVIAIAMLLPGEGSIASRFDSADVGTFNGRTAIWSYSWDYFLASGPIRMLFGNGLASTGYFLTPAIPEFGNLHNTYLLWLMEQGVAGLIVFVIFLYSLGRRTVSSTHPGKHLMLGWLVFLLAAGLSGTVSDEHVFWIIMGVLAGANSSGANFDHLRGRAFAEPQQFLPSMVRSD